MRRISALVLPALLYAALPAAAQTSLAPQISGNSVTAKIQLPGGVEADHSIAFEQVVGLNSNAVASLPVTRHLNKEGYIRAFAPHSWRPPGDADAPSLRIGRSSFPPLRCPQRKISKI